MANIDPLFIRIGDLSNNAGTGMNQAITLAANDFTGAGANNSLVFTADATTGSFLQRLRFKAIGANTAQVTARIFINNGSVNTTATNNTFYGELTLPVTTAQTTYGTAEIDYSMNILMPPGFRVFVGLTAAPSAGWIVLPVGGRY